MKKIFTLIVLVLIATFLFSQTERVSQVASVEKSQKKTEITRNLAAALPAAAKSEEEKTVDEMVTHFEELMAKTTDLKKLTPEERHHTPKLMIRSAETVGTLVDWTKKDSSRIAEFSKKFENCYQNDAIDEIVRALCRSGQRKIDENSLKPIVGEDAKSIETISLKMIL
jgi:hypothetical protein